MQCLIITFRLKAVTKDEIHLQCRDTFIGLIPEPVRFTPENTEYSASCALSKKACLYMKVKNTTQITYHSGLELRIFKITT
jgi:hypothetical protein